MYYFVAKFKETGVITKSDGFIKGLKEALENCKRLNQELPFYEWHIEDEVGQKIEDEEGKLYEPK